MPFTNGVFKRLFSWQADAVAGKGISPVEFDQDGDDVAAALSNALLRDGTGLPTADTPWNGKKITNLSAAQNAGDALALGQVPSSEVVRALGFVPARDYYARDNAGHYLGLAWNTASAALGLFVDNIFQGNAWTSQNLTAAQVAAILGYTPGRSGMAFVAGTPSSPDAPVGQTARGYYCTAAFTATAPNLVGISAASMQNNTAGSGAVTGIIGSDLLDLTTNTVVATGSESLAGLVSGNGPASLVSLLVTPSLVVGRNYQLRLYAYKSAAAGVTPVLNMVTNGMCFG